MAEQKLLQRTAARIAGVVLVGFVLVFCAFYFATPCSVSGGMPSPNGITLSRQKCTCLGFEYQKFEEQVPDKPSTYMCAGIVLNRYEE